MIDVKNKRSIRVALNPVFQMKGLTSEFVKLRKKGVEPSDIPSEIIDPLIKKIVSVKDEEILKIEKVKNTDFKPEKGTFYLGTM